VVGWIDPATRQNAGRLEKAVPSGAVNGPAGTETAVVIVVSASERFAIPSQVEAANNRLMPIKPIKRTWSFVILADQSTAQSSYAQPHAAGHDLLQARAMRV